MTYSSAELATAFFSFMVLLAVLAVTAEWFWVICSAIARLFAWLFSRSTCIAVRRPAAVAAGRLRSLQVHKNVVDATLPAGDYENAPAA